MLPPPCRYMPWSETGFSPNIMIDGAAKANTVLTLSHWPKSGTPENLKRDTSTEIVFDYLMQPGQHMDVGLVTGDHFDEDASLGLFVMLEPEFALAHRDLIVAAASAGDFAVCRDRQAARVAFTIAALADPAVSPLSAETFEGDYDTMCGQLFREVLPRLRAIIEHTDAYHELWGLEDRFLDRSEQALNDGTIAITEHTDVDLAIVTVTEDLRTDATRDLASRSNLPYHPMAVHNATKCNRVLTVHGNEYTFSYRYESWVQYMSAPPPPRVDLHGLAAELSQDEPGDATWKFDGVEVISPTMTLQGTQNGESAIAVDDFVQRLSTCLAAGEGAWDPFDRPGDKPGMLALPH
jgi:hypothetical protein